MCDDEFVIHRLCWPFIILCGFDESLFLFIIFIPFIKHERTLPKKRSLRVQVHVLLLLESEYYLNFLNRIALKNTKPFSLSFPHKFKRSGAFKHSA